MVDFRVLGPLSIERSATALPKMVRTLLTTLLSRADRHVSSKELIEALWGETAPPSARKILQIYVRRLRAAIGEEHPIVAEADGYRIVVNPGWVAHPAGPVPHQLPAAPTGFAGRMAEQRALDDIDPAAGSGLVIVAGTAGVGKTALVLHWAHHAARRFPDGQLYVSLNGFSTSPPVKPLEALGLMLRSLNVPAERVPLIESEAAALFRTLMTGRRCLVVLDDASSAEQVRPLLSGAGLTLVTSRRNLSGLVAHDGALRLNLDVLPAGDAEALLVGVLGEERIAAEPRAAGDLARVCAHLPLALRVAAAHLSDSPHRRLADHVAALRRGDRLGSLAIEGDARSAVRATFDLSYQDIPEEARRTFGLLGLAPVLDFSGAAVAALTGHGSDETERQLGRLADAHLIERLGRDRYTFHELLRLYAREHISAQERDIATRRLYDWYVDSVYAALDLLHPHLVRMPLDRTYSQRFGTPQEALAWLDLERSNLIAVIRSAAEHGPFDAAWLLAGGLRGYLSRHRYLTEWTAAATVALDAANAHGDSRACASAHLTLAHAYRTQQRYGDGETHLKHAAAIAEKDGWLEMQAASMGNLGAVHFEVGDMTDAVQVGKKAYDLYVKAGSHRGAAVMLGNIGVGLYHTGRLPEASSVLSRTIQLAVELDLVQRESTVMGDLGMVMWHVGRPAAAHRLLVRAVSKKIAFGDRLGESFVLADLAEFYRHHGHSREGMELASRAVHLGREFGEASAEAHALVAVGDLRVESGETGEAIRCHQLALEVARAVGVRLPQVAALLGLAKAHFACGETNEAFSLAEEALGLSRSAGYGLREGEALTLSAAISHAAGDRRRAVILAREAARVHRETGSRLGLAGTLALLAQLGEQADDMSILIRPSRIKPHDYATLTKGGRI